MQTICTSLQTDNHANTSSRNFYMPDALPDAQQTASKQWRHSYHRKLKNNNRSMKIQKKVILTKKVSDHKDHITRRTVQLRKKTGTHDTCSNVTWPTTLLPSFPTNSFTFFRCSGIMSASTSFRFYNQRNNGMSHTLCSNTAINIHMNNCSAKVYNIRNTLPVK